MNWKYSSCLVVFFAAACPLVAYGDDPATSQENPEAQRFEAAKRQRQRAVAFVYVRTAKVTADGAWQVWHPPASGKLLITKVKMTLGANGKISDYKVVAGSGSEPEDKSVQDCLRGATFQPLPIGLSSLDLYWTLMSDGTMNMVENTDSSEANAYYTDLIGGSLPSNGGGINMRPHRHASPSPDGRGSGGAQTDPGAPYMADLQRRIKRAWFPPKGCETKKVVVVFKVHRGGNMSDLRIVLSSGVTVADEAALKAVENASPFRPLPAGSSEEVELQFTLD